MGLTVDIYRTRRLPDCTNRGTSSRHDSVCVVNVAGPSTPSDTNPPMLLVAGPLGCPILVDAVPDGDGWKTSDGWSMFGGNVADTSDSRWGRAVKQVWVDGHRERGFTLPSDQQPDSELFGWSFPSVVHIHDRFERPLGGQ